MKRQQSPFKGKAAWWVLMMVFCAQCLSAAEPPSALVQVTVSKDQINVQSRKADRKQGARESMELGHVFEIRNISGRPLQNLELELVTEIQSDSTLSGRKIVTHTENFSIPKIDVGGFRIVRTKHYTLVKSESNLPIARGRTGTTANIESKLRKVKATLKENGLVVWKLK